jgi:hypothetical protein
MKGKTHLYNGSSKAQGMVEFALILPVLLVLLFGIMEFGRLLFIYVTTTSASREAARYGTAVGPSTNNLPRFRDCAGMREAAKRVGILSNLRDEDILIWYDYGPGTATYGFDCSPNVDVPLGSRVVVQVHTPYAPIVPMVPINLNQVEAASARTIVKDVSVGVAAVPPPPESENPPPFVSFEIASQSGPESGYMEVNVILSDASGNPTVAPQSITVTFDVGGTAEQGLDYTLSTNPLIIPAGQGGATFRINVIEDTLYEADETVVLAISDIENGRYGSILVHTAIILNDDPAPLISFRYESSDISEAALGPTTNRVANIEVRLDAVSGQPAYATLELSGTAERGLDYELLTPSLVEIPAGSTSVFVMVEILDDLMDEDDETVLLTLVNPMYALVGTPSQHTLTILDNDLPPTVSFEVAAQRVPEGAAQAEVVVQLSVPSGREIRVPFTVSGTALAGDDYTLVTTSPLVIPPGQLSGVIEVDITVDTDYEEPDETVILTIGTPVNATRVAPYIHTITITEEPTVWFELRQQTRAEDAGLVRVNVRLSPPATDTVEIPFTLSGTATLGADYTITTSPVQITAGGTNFYLNVNLINDTIHEENETLIITLGEPTNAELGSPFVHTLTITDNDPMPTVSFSSTSQRVIENAGSASITAVLSGLSSRNVSVPFTTSGTATRGSDYTISASPLIIPAGNLSADINVNIIADDDYNEPDETVIVSMDEPDYAGLGSPSEHTLTIASPVCPTAPVNPSFGTGNDSTKLTWNIQNSRMAPARLMQISITWPSAGRRLTEVKFGVDTIGEAHLFPASDGFLNITTPSPLWEGEFYTSTLTFLFTRNLNPNDGTISVLASFENCPTITGFYGR